MASCIPEPLRVTQVLDSRFPHGYSSQCVEHEKRISGSATSQKSTGVKPGFDAVEGQNANSRLPPSRSRRRRAPPAAAANFAGKRSGLVFEEYLFVPISSALLVQPDEGVSDLVVDWIGVTTTIYREEPGS
ncbi:hypothetical protein F511_42643 [Dorcoceras hygrometricum]|uniref:Uncharacterized protein n=1 Tax=Dorcoceras hygrometricum TaxID=472368 RepID=A0A2Z7DCT2_9LAMI|nr:hypothetical protein F511_42643 [Dorcoceras hygrometricum]